VEGSSHDLTLLLCIPKPSEAGCNDQDFSQLHVTRVRQILKYDLKIHHVSLFPQPS
jgi:hypothetical protein